MSFVDLYFWIGVPFAVAAFYLSPPKLRPACLLALSLGYYTLVSGFYVLLLLAETVLAFGSAKYMARATDDGQRFRRLIAALVPIVGTLVIFKLGNALPGLLAPLGISYYTFKLIAYQIEVYWDDGEQADGLLSFAAYVAFGPQMVSGPIQRPGDFLTQLPAACARANGARLFDGFRMILDGLMLKLIVGDRLGAFIARVDAAPGDYSRGVIAATLACYLPYLYADFAGYTKIALGLGKLFGIDGPPNFNAPFSARNVQDYWRRWHMSLTGWLTDYVFLPLRMTTRSWGTAGLVFSIFTNMVLVGIWHRISLNYLAFGLIQGLFLSVSALTLAPRERTFRRWEQAQAIRAVGSALIVFALMSLSMVVWFAPTLQDAALHFSVAAGMRPAGPSDFATLPVEMHWPIAVAAVVAYYHGWGAPAAEAVFTRVRRFAPAWAIQGCKLLLIAVLAADQGGGSFIYGQF